MIYSIHHKHEFNYISLKDMYLLRLKKGTKYCNIVRAIITITKHNYHNLYYYNDHIIVLPLRISLNLNHTALQQVSF